MGERQDSPSVKDLNKGLAEFFANVNEKSREIFEGKFPTHLVTKYRFRINSELSSQQENCGDYRRIGEELCYRIIPDSLECEAKKGIVRRGIMDQYTIGVGLGDIIKQFTNLISKYFPLEKLIGNGIVMRRIDSVNLAHQMIDYYYKTNPNFALDLGLVERMSSQLLDYFASTKISTNRAIYIENILPRIEKSQFSENAELRPLTPADLEKLLNDNDSFAHHYGFPSKRHPALVGAVLTLNFEDDRFHGEVDSNTKDNCQCMWEKRRRLLQDLLFCLRVVVNEPIHTSSVFETVDIMPFFNFASSEGHFSPILHGPRAELDKSALGRARTLFSQIHEARADSSKPSNNTLDLLATRITYADERLTIEDAALDIYIGLEILVKGILIKKPGKPKKGKSITDPRMDKKQLARYVANLLGNTPSQKSEVYEKIVNGYEVRNNIVHEGKECCADDRRRVEEAYQVLKKAVYAAITKPNLVRDIKNKKPSDLLF